MTNRQIILLGGENLDERIKKLAKNIVNYSISLKKGEKVLIEACDADHNIIKALIEEIYAVGGYPYVNLTSGDINRALLMGTTEERIKPFADLKLQEMKIMNAFISIRGNLNMFETIDTPKEKGIINLNIMEKVQKYRIDNTKWVILLSPTPSAAQAAKMSSEQYEDFYYKVCTLDYSKMSKAMDNLVTLMNKTDKVRLVTPSTDISFSIKGIPAVKCAGKMNIPDGEVFTAPIRNSVNGIIKYNLDTLYNGVHFSNICLEVKNGKIIKATGTNEETLNAILDTDENARYFGEFAIGVNPHIRQGSQNILFDEKMCGSIHFTPGSCYETETPNGNISAIHWDMVLSMLPENGGGEIYFDNKLIRKDGLFVIPDLFALNPENLM